MYIFPGMCGWYNDSILCWPPTMPGQVVTSYLGFSKFVADTNLELWVGFSVSEKSIKKLFSSRRNVAFGILEP